MLTPANARALALAMQTEKSLRESRWRELSRWICPTRGIFTSNAWERRDEREILRFTQPSQQACLAGASGLTSGMTPRNAAWFKPDFRYPEMIEYPGARSYLDSLDRLLKNCLSSGGFYQAIHAFNMDLIWAGCALLFAEDTDCAGEAALRYECQQIGTWAVTLDRQGSLNRVARKLSFTVSDLIDTFGESAVSKRALRLKEKQPLDRVEVWHLALREEEERFAVSSYWWEEGSDSFLRESGYHEMPFFFTCWSEGATVYGTGPGDEALADARQIDVLERHKLEGLAKIINPPVAAPSHLKGHCNLQAGAINYVPDRSQIIPLMDLASFAQSLPHVRQEIATVITRLEHSLLSSIFSTMPLTQRPAGMSATEFLERKREALQQLGPVISAYEPSVLTPLLFRTLQALDRAGATAPPPESLAGLPLEVTVEFISPMANALRQTTAETARALFSDVAMMMKSCGDTSVLDKVDFDQLVDELATGLGAPGSIIRADADVSAIRQQRQQKEQMLEAMQMQSMQAQGMMADASARSAQAQADMTETQTYEDEGINILGEGA